MELRQAMSTPHPITAHRALHLLRALVLAAAALPIAAAPARSWPQISPSLGDFLVFKATASNSFSDYTLIDDPLTNNNPNAIVIAGQNWNPGGGGGVYNARNEGVWYSSFFNKWAVFNQNVVAMPLGAAFNIMIPATSASIFIHTATAANITANSTTIDNPLTNGNPNALLTITQNWNPGGVGGIYNNHPVGVWYTGANWAIFNQDLAAMPAGAAFNVLVASTNAPTFIQAATVANITSNYTVIDNPAINGNPNAVLTVTQNWNPGGIGGTYNNHPIGVWYTGTKWAIFNQDIAAMPVGAAFNVAILTHRADMAVHFATAGNTAGDYTLFDLPETDGHPEAIALATQDWNPPGGSAIYNPHPPGVWYDGVPGEWGVFNEDITAMPLSASFDILTPGSASVSFVHTAKAGNVTGDYTRIDNPTTNGKPNALLIVTQDWNPNAASGVYNNHNEGVWYDGSKWAIFNEDLATMAVGPSYNVLVLGAEYSAFVQTATAANISGDWTKIDNPATNGFPFATLMVTQNWNPGGTGGIYNNHPIGVWYTGSNWAIFNEDLAPMTMNASFNVLVGHGLGALGVDDPLGAPNAVRLLPNRPNPFRRTTSIGFVLPAQAKVSLDVLDIAGREVSRLWDGELGPGEHDFVFDAKNLVTGVYFCQLRVAGNTQATVQTRKLLLTR